MEAEWEKHKQEVGAYHGMQEVLVKLIADAYDLQYLREIWDEFTGFDEVTCRDMIEHLTAKVKLTTMEKATSKLRGAKPQHGHCPTQYRRYEASFWR